MSQALLRFLSLGEVWVGVLGLAAFLALFWVLRGAPVGQAVRPEEDEEAPHWTRDPHTGQFRLLTNMDVAMFLEFGTARMEPKTPWLYDAWDRNVVKLPALIKEYTVRNQAGGTPFAIRNHLGQFAPHEGP